MRGICWRSSGSRVVLLARPGLVARTVPDGSVTFTWSTLGAWPGGAGRLSSGDQSAGDLLSVKTAVLDEYLVGARPGDDDAGKINAGYVAFESFGVAEGEAVRSFEADTHALEEAKVGLVSGH